MKYRFMDENRGAHSVGKMAEALGVSRSGYHNWSGRPESDRSRENRELIGQIRRIQERKKYRYGSPRVTRELWGEGVRVGENRVARLMRENGLGARPKRQYRATTDSSHRLQVAENVLQRRFEVAEPDLVWVSDITYVATSEGWMYLAVVMDLHSRKIVGWSMSSRMSTDLVLRAFMMAVLSRRPPRGLIFHSDRGSQYCSRAFVAALQRRGIVQSMSGKGDCWDNAPAESFFKTLKNELIARRIYPSRERARAEIFQYIEVFYNRQRRHSGLDYMTPVEFEEAFPGGCPDTTCLEKMRSRPATKAVSQAS